MTSYRFVAGAVCLIGLVWSVGAVAQPADAYPARPVTIIVPFPAGGSADLNARTVAERLSVALGQPFIVENKAGASGNVGTASAAKHDAIRAQGVAHAIDYRTTDFEAEVLRLTDGEGIDIAFDAIGPTSFRKDYRLLRPGGRLICYGLSEIQSGEGRDIAAAVKGLVRMTTATMPWWKSMAIMNENKGVFGLNMLHWWDREGSLDRVVAPLADDLAAGRLEPVVAASFPFEEAAAAHRYIHERRNVGKVVLVP